MESIISSSDILDIVILGVPKAGTSSLFSALAEHPEVIGSIPKETFFFLDSSHPLCGNSGYSLLKDGEQAFQNIFPHDNKKQLRIEATTHNLYSETAQSYFKKTDNTKFIVMLREPASRIYSLFSYVRDQQCNLSKKIDFSTYVNYLLADNIDSLAKYFKNRSSFFALKNAINHSNYAYWLKCWHFAQQTDRLKLIIFEEFKHDPVKILKNISTWLDADQNFYNNYNMAVRNKTQMVRNSFIHRSLRKLSNLTPKLLNMNWIKNFYYKCQMIEKPRNRSSLYNDNLLAYNRLKPYFTDMREELFKNYKLDVYQWWD
jgi:hypothetical protein